MNRDESNVSIVDIAKKTGLSVATVSRVINGYQFIKPETKERVLAAIAESGFTRNSIASSLRSKKTHTIGMIVPRVSMYFHAEVITVVQTELYSRGYNLIICQSNDDIQMEHNLLISLLNSRVDGIVIACSMHTVDSTYFSVLQKNNIPVVFYDRVPSHLESYVGVVKGDDYNGGVLAANELINNGCKKIAAVFGLLTSNLYIDRSKGFIDTLKANNINIYPEWFYYQELTSENAKQALLQIFANEIRPDAIFFANDTSAIAAVEFASENGINIPNDLKIIGYSNDPRSRIITPSITSIEQDASQFGTEVVAKMMHMIETGKEAENGMLNETIIPVKLIKRASSTARS